MSNPFANAMSQLDKAAKIMNLDKNIHEILKQPDRVLTVAIPVKMDNGEVRVFTGYRSQYNNALGPYKGGIRYHQNVSIDEVKALSFWMMVKCATVNIPMGGGKGGVIVDSKTLSVGELERLSRGYIQKIWRSVGAQIDVPAPDMYTTPTIMGWMQNEFEKLLGKPDPGFITGKAIKDGGSEGRETATAQGGVYVVRELAKKLGLKPAVRGSEEPSPRPETQGSKADSRREETKVAIQGMGNVGGFMAKILSADGYKIVAISDSKGGVYGENIDLNKLFVHKEQTGSVQNFEGTQNVSNNELLELPVDILVPAAMENQITKDNVNNIKAKVIVEMANGPTTPEADEILKSRGIILIPDVLANAGGVTVSCFEWEQNVKGERWTEAQVFAKLEPMMIQAFNEVWETKEKYNIDMRTAAFVKAIERVASKTQM